MGKLTAYVVGLAVALALSYYALSGGYSPLISWLGPIASPSISYLLSLLFLLFGNIFSSFALFGTWILVGAVVGLAARKGTKAIGGAIAIYMSLWIFLGISALAMVVNLSGVSGLGGTSTVTSNMQVPPLPPNVTVSAILLQPLFQPLLTVLTSIVSIPSFGGIGIGGVGSAGGVSAGSLVSTLVGSFVPFLIINLAIFLAVSGIVGYAVNRYLLPVLRGGTGNTEKVQGKEEAKERQDAYSKEAKDEGGDKTSHPAALFPILIVILLLMVSFYIQAPGENGTSPTVPGTSDVSMGQAQNSEINASLSAAGLALGGDAGLMTSAVSGTQNTTSLDYGAGVVSTFGNIYNLYAFVNLSQGSGSQFLVPDTVAQPILSLLVVSNNLSDIFSALSLDRIINVSSLDVLQSNQYFNLIPQAVLILAFSGNLSETSVLAQKAALNVSENIGGSSLQKFFALSVNLGSGSGSNASSSLYAYSLSASDSLAEKYLLQRSTGYLPQDGMFTVFRNGVNSGYLVPGSTDGSVNGTIFVAGQINAGAFSAANFTSILNGTVPSATAGNLYFMGGIYERHGVYHSSGPQQVIGASQIFGYGGSITFGHNSTAYALSIIYPYINGSSSNNAGYNATVYSTVSNFTLFVSAGSTLYYQVEYGFILNFSGVTQTTNNVFPADLIISVSASRISGNSFNVTISIANRNSKAIEGVYLTGNSLINAYGGNMIITSGTPSVTMAYMPSGETMTMSYSVTISGVGSYYVANPLLNYTTENVSFSIPLNSVSKSAQAPFFVNSANDATFSAFNLIFGAIHFPVLVYAILPGFYVFDLVIVLIVALAVFLEYRAYVRWTKQKGNNS